MVQPRRLLRSGPGRGFRSTRSGSRPSGRSSTRGSSTARTSSAGPSGGSSGGGSPPGLSRQHHDEIHRRLAPFLLPAKGSSPSKKAGRPKPEPHELAEMWRCAASLERLAPEVEGGARRAPLIKELSRPATGGHVLWCLGRLGARVPLYGPANTVVRTEAVERWIDALLERAVRPRPRDRPTPSSPCRSSPASRATGRGTSPTTATAGPRPPRTRRRRGDPPPVREYNELEAAQEGQALGDALPIGLRLRQEESQPSTLARTGGLNSGVVRYGRNGCRSTPGCVAQTGAGRRS